MNQDHKRILIVIVIVLMTILSILKLQDNTYSKSKAQKSTKEIEFNHAQIIEVDQNKIKSVTHAKNIYKTKNDFVMFGVDFKNSYKDRLKSKKAIQKGKNIYFYKDVVFARYSGFTYYTSYAIYNRITEILTINKRFKAVRENDTFYGNSMIYHSNGGYIDAQKVDSILSLEKK